MIFDDLERSRLFVKILEVEYLMIGARDHVQKTKRKLHISC